MRLLLDLLDTGACRAPTLPITLNQRDATQRTVLYELPVILTAGDRPRRMLARQNRQMVAWAAGGAGMSHAGR